MWRGVIARKMQEKIRRPSVTAGRFSHAGVYFSIRIQDITCNDHSQGRPCTMQKGRNPNHSGGSTYTTSLASPSPCRRRLQNRFCTRHTSSTHIASLHPKSRSLKAFTALNERKQSISLATACNSPHRAQGIE